MCRNIRPLFNFDPPATDEEIQDAAVQFVRKVSGTRKPSGKNVFPFERAIEDIAAVTRKLVDSLETTAQPNYISNYLQRLLAGYPGGESSGNSSGSSNASSYGTSTPATNPTANILGALFGNKGLFG